MKTTTRILSIVSVCCLLFACSSASKKSDESAQANPADPLDQNSALTIEYQLGHASHVLQTEARAEAVSGKASVDHELLHESKVDRAKYRDLFARTQKFMSEHAAEKRDPAGSATPCRNAFKITTRLGDAVQTLSGCRFGEDGVVMAKIIRDVEILLYSKN